MQSWPGSSKPRGRAGAKSSAGWTQLIGACPSPGVPAQGTRGSLPRCHQWQVSQSLAPQTRLFQTLRTAEGDLFLTFACIQQPNRHV